jgi:hypothetical protein
MFWKSAQSQNACGVSTIASSCYSKFATHPAMPHSEQRSQREIEVERQYGIALYRRQIAECKDTIQLCKVMLSIFPSNSAIALEFSQRLSGRDRELRMTEEALAQLSANLPKVSRNPEV